MPVTLTVSTWHLKTTVHVEWIVNKRQTTTKMLTKYLYYYFWRVRIFQTVILILQRVLDFGCRIPHVYGMLTPFSEYKETTIRKSPKTQNYSIQSMENLPVIIAEVSVAHSGDSFRNTFFFCACFSRFTVGSSKTRQITIWALGLIPTNHDMRPIGLMMIVMISALCGSKRF